ncbi:MAG: 7,8-didemethyl-8-hydroxy-5-deazariboflavin synthase CofG [Dehalococcoidia bacterium]
MGDVIAKASEFLEITDEEALSLSSYSEDHLDDLCGAAAKMRNHGKGTTVTFSPKVFIPLTRLCRDYCGYCTFRIDPDQTQSLYMSAEEVLDVAKQGENLGCTEALFTLGERPEQKYPEAKEWLSKNGYNSTLDYLGAMTELVVKETKLLPHANPGTMTHRELKALKGSNPSTGIMLESTSQLLYQEGGPHEFAPSKRPIVRLKTISIAGELRIPFTTGLLIGIGETMLDRMESLLEIRNLQRKYNHIQETIIQNFRAKPETPMAESPDAETQEMLWTVAAARIILGPQANIQVPPNLSSENYEMYLTAGINDWGGVSPLTIDYVNPEAPWPLITNLKAKTESAGFELKPRLAVYPEYFLDTEEYLPVDLLAKVRGLADDQGYVKDGINRYV